MKTRQDFKKWGMRFQLTRETLARTKKKALRKRIWFRVLTKLERGILDLTVRCVERVRSPLLERSLTTILSKLSDALEKGYMYVVEKTGRPLAAKISSIAKSWGNESAQDWRRDRALIRYLGATATSIRRSALGGQPT